jgi:hypothetical protein
MVDLDAQTPDERDAYIEEVRAWTNERARTRELRRIQTFVRARIDALRGTRADLVVQIGEAQREGFHNQRRIFEIDLTIRRTRA